MLCTYTPSRHTIAPLAWATNAFASSSCQVFAGLLTHPHSSFSLACGCTVQRKGRPAVSSDVHVLSLQLSPMPFPGTVPRTGTNTTPAPVPLPGWPPVMLWAALGSGEGEGLLATNMLLCALSLSSQSLGQNVKRGAMLGKGHKTGTILVNPGRLVTLLILIASMPCEGLGRSFCLNEGTSERDRKKHGKLLLREFCFILMTLYLTDLMHWA